jgi:murein DD-endopeptidase MepM/ murein hydrolase activator NlpD
MKKHALALACSFIAYVPLAAQAQYAGELEIRFCPAAQVRTYPLESRRDIRSLVLQNLVVINHGSAPVEVASVTLSLMQGADALDERRIQGAELQQYTSTGPKLQAAGMLELLAFQFCGQELIPAGTKLSGPQLAPGQALLLTYTTMAFRGKRDTLRASVSAHAGERSLEARASLPIRSEESKTVFRFPLHGVWFVAVGPTPHTGHRWARMEEFAFDIARFGDGNLTHRGDGAQFSDYYAYGAEVLAAADGKVVGAVGNVAEDKGMLRGPGDTDESYGERAQKAQMALLQKGGDAAVGNYVVIDHGNGEYSLYAHLQPASVRVHAGESVRAGQVIGKLGSSGNSTEPHLHFQVCDGPEPLNCSSIPIHFDGLELPYADYPRALQSGDVVRAP